MTRLDRGFKSWVERAAAGLRREMRLKSHEPLNPADVAKLLDVRLITPLDVPGVPRAVLDQLLKRDPSGWSAVSVALDGVSVVIYNPKHSKGRQASDIMHELAHFILDHRPATLILSHDGNMVMRSYDAKQEEEANHLAWGLLLPRDALVNARWLNLSTEEIADHFGVSQKLVSFRMDTTGVNRQFARARTRSREA